MGKSDHCAVWGCSNDRRFPQKYVTKEHISAFDGCQHIRFWSCKRKFFGTWSKLINREVINKTSGKKSLFRVGKSTKVCSNHFQYGKPTDSYPHPTLFLKGYNDDGPSNPKRRRLDRSAAVDQTNTEMTTVDVAKNTENCKVAEVIDEETTDCNYHVSAYGDCVAQDQECTPQKLLNISEEHNSSRLSWESISGSNSIIKVYTGCPTAKVFPFIVDRIRSKHRKVCYFKGRDSYKAKSYQLSPSKDLSRKKPGPSRKLTLEDEILLTLMRIRLDSPVEDLAFRFGISAGHASNICTTFIVLLARELEPLIYWPTPEETLSFKHPHFSGEFNKVEGIGDCTEQVIQRPANSKAQYQTYSTYKSRNTQKKLIFCTKGGSISFLSKSYSGCASDRFITEDCNVVQKFHPGFIAMFDKGFIVQDIFLPRHVTVKIPPFVRSKRQFTPSEIHVCKRIARARIHIERAIGRLKEFRLLDHTLPLTMIDIVDEIWVIAAAITNLQPPLIKGEPHH